MLRTVGMDIVGATRGDGSAGSSRRRGIVATVVAALVLALGVVLPGAFAPALADAPGTPAAAQNTNPLTVTDSGTDVLAGATGTVRVTAAYPVDGPGADLYNASIVVVLPPGIAYAGGASGIQGLGEPRQVTYVVTPASPGVPAVTATALVWDNVTDVPKGSELEISVPVTADPAAYPAGSSFTVDAGVYANSNERVVPRITVPPVGPPTVDATDGWGDAAVELDVIPLELTKTNDDAEGEVYRGPDNATRYTLIVRTAQVAGTNDVVVVDRVPAEYVVTGCSDGCTREIVTVDGAVYTQLTWNLGDLPGDSVTTLTYDAYVGLRTITAPDGTQDGEPTRPGGSGDAIRNTATATGTYGGDVAAGASTSVETSDTATATLLDLGVVKTSAAGDFHAGERATFTLHVRSSQYVDAADVVVTDTVPNGMCPIVPAGVDVTGAAWPADCPQPGTAATDGSVTGGTMTGVVVGANGTFTVTFALADGVEPEDLEEAISYQVHMRESYQDGSLTSVGDGFVNTAQVTGDLTPTEENTVDDDLVTGTNGSAAELSTGDVSMDKTVWSNPERVRISATAPATPGQAMTNLTCADGTAPASEWVGEGGPNLQLGDLVCFTISSVFPAGVATRDVRLVDFLPEGTELVGWAPGAGAPESGTSPAVPANTVTITQPDPAVASWLLGDQLGSSRVVERGEVLTLVVLARVTEVSQNVPDVTGNLAKMRYTDGHGRVVGLRDQVDLTLAPPVPLATEKLADGVSVRDVNESSVVTFTVDVAHRGTAANRTDYPLDSVEVWDVLPAGFSCDDLLDATVSPAFEVCTPAVGSIPATIVWKLTGPSLRTALEAGTGSDGDELWEPGETLRITYDLDVPSPLSIGTEHTNTAAVTRYTAPTTDGIAPTTAPYYPTNPVGAYPDETKNAPEASDTATLRLANATVAKTVYATQNGGIGAPATATIGEWAVYHYSVTVPPYTSVFNGVLDDALPMDRFEQVGTPSIQGFPTFGASAPTDASAECVASADGSQFVLCEDGRLLFPTTWTNTTGDPVTFTIGFTAKVRDVPANQHGVTIPNTATFTSSSTVAGSPVLRDSAVATLGVVEPAPAVRKYVSTPQPTTSVPGNDVSITTTGGATAFFTIRVTNPAGRSTAHDTVVTDCVPARLGDVTQVGTAPQGSVAIGAAGSCANGGSQITWTVGDVPANGTLDLFLATTVDETAAAGNVFANRADLTATSMPGVVDGERTYTSSDGAEVRIANVTGAKSAQVLGAPGNQPAGSAVPGQTIRWTVRADIPGETSVYDFALVDLLPRGVGSPTNVTVTCSWTTDPSLCAVTQLASTTSNNRERVAFLLGDVTQAGGTRTVTVTYDTVVNTVASGGYPVHSQTLTNAAQPRWNASSDGTPPTSSGGTWDISGSEVAASVTVREPTVSTQKSVTNTRPAQGDVFTYSVQAAAVTTDTASNRRNVTAYGVTVVDTVPAGVVPVADASGTPLADGATITSGALTGTWNAGARTITWTIAQLVPGTPQTFSYSAKLAPASSLTGAGLVNRAGATGWSSLPSGGRDYTATATSTTTVTPQFPLVDTVKRRVTGNPVYIGQEVEYTITLTNRASDANRTGAVAVSLDAVDTLPADWAFVPGSATVSVRGAAPVALADPSIDARVLTWAGVGGSGVDLAPGQSVVIRYLATPLTTAAAGMSVDHTNDATAANVTDRTGGTSYNGGSGSYVGTRGSATANIALADLRVTKAANDDFVAGATAPGTWRLTVDNLGPDAAVGVAIHDVVTLPEGVTNVTTPNAAAEGWTCAPAVVAGGTATIDCVRSNANEQLAVGQTRTLTVAASVAASVPAGTQVPNTATVSATTLDRQPDNDTSSDPGIVRGEADLGVVKAVTDPAAPATAVVAGEPIGWSVTLTNHGPSVSRGSSAAPILLTDSLPANVTDVVVDEAALPVGVTCDAPAGGSLVCRVTRDLAVGESVVVRLAAQVPADVAAGGSVVNSATVTPVTPEPAGSTGNNTSTTTTPTAVREALTIQKSIAAPEGTPVAGDVITYRVAVSNAGPSVARGVFVVDASPAHTSFVQLTETDSGAWSTTAAAGQRGNLRLDRGPVLGVGQTTTFEIAVRIDDDYVMPDPPVDLVNVVTVSSAWREDQDTSQVGVNTREEADLAIVKTVSADVVIAGGEGVTYTLAVTNKGPSQAADLVVSDTLPAGVTLDGDVPAGCTTSEQDGRQTVTCTRETLGTVASGATPWLIELPVLVAADVQAAGLDNTATVTSATPEDPATLEDNTSTVPLDVLQRASLRVEKSGAPDPVTAGEDVTWTIVVHNDGPSDAQAVTLADTLDPRLAFRSVIAEQGSCSGAPDLACTLGTIPAGGSVTITLVTRVASSVPEGTDEAPTLIGNEAVATSSTLDAETDEPATARDDDDVRVVARTALGIDKRTTTPVVDAGADATFEIDVTNAGPSDAAAPVVVTDTLPVGMTFVSHGTVTPGGSTWACAAQEPTDAGQVVTCTLRTADDSADATLPAGTVDAPVVAPTLRLTAHVDQALEASTLTNDASATSPSSPTSPEDTADVEVVTHADLTVEKSHDPSVQAIAGTPFTWTVVVTNKGASRSVATADDPIVVTDVLPLGVTLSTDPGLGSGGEGTTCAALPDLDDDGHQVVVCELTESLDAGASVTLTLNVDLDEALTGSVTNLVNVAPGLTPQPDQQVWPDTDTDEVPIVEIADLAIAKEVTTDPVVAGRAVSWDVTVTNLGPSNSDADPEHPITVTETLPLGVTGAVGTGEGWECVADAGEGGAEGREVLTCTRDADLAVGQAPVITVTGTLASGWLEPIVNDAAVAPGLTDQPDTEEALENDTTQVTTPITTLVDLVLGKAVSADLVAGATGRYVLTVTNLGPSDARDVTLVDTLPAGVELVGVVPGADGTEPEWTCEVATGEPGEPGEPDPSAGQAVDCALVADGGVLAAGGTISFEIEVSVAQQLQGDIVNTATVTSTTPEDPATLEDNTATATGTVAEVADLSIVKSALGSPVVGQALEYELVVSNAGPSTARGLVVSDLVPPSLQVTGVSVDDSGEGSTDATLDCAALAAGETGTPVVCTLPELAAGATAPTITVTVTVLAAAYPSVVNTATVDAATPEDPATLEDNTSSVVLEVPALTDLVIDKELTAQLVAGRTGMYTLTVTNEGPTPEPGPVTVTDELPAGLTLRSAAVADDAGQCSTGSGTAGRDLVTCTLTTTLAVGESAVVTLVVDVSRDASGTIVNTAGVTSPNDPTPGTDSASGEVDRSKLPATGAQIGAAAAGAALLLLLGALLVVWQRRRRSALTD